MSGAPPEGKGAAGKPRTPTETIEALLPPRGEAPLPLPYAVREDLRVQWGLLAPITSAVAMRLLRLEVAVLALSHPRWARDVAPRASLAGSRFDLLAYGDTVLAQWLAALPAGTREGLASTVLAERGAQIVAQIMLEGVPSAEEVEAQADFSGPGGGG